MSAVMLACGCSSMSVHSAEHDGLPNPHPSCVVHYDRPGGPACVVVAAPDLSGRLAVCGSYGAKWGRGAGPIYPDGRTLNGGMCSPDGCFCVVPSSADLPFFAYRDRLMGGSDRWCAAKGDGPGFDGRGQCTYGRMGHRPFGDRPPGLREISTRYVSHCHRCARPIRPSTVVLWGAGERGQKVVYHATPAECPPQHEFAPRTDLGEDTFFCGCQGWD